MIPSPLILNETIVRNWEIYGVISVVLLLDIVLWLPVREWFGAAVWKLTVWERLLETKNRTVGLIAFFIKQEIRD
jgi:hypothetical protein